MFEQYLNQIKSKANLNREQSAEFLGIILDDQSLGEEEIADFLRSMTEKSATTDEILGFIDAMQARMQTVANSRTSIDVCGTGGDKSNSFNISTASAIVLASGGVNVAKHGNRSASSKCGSADVLEQMGVPIDLDPQSAEDYLAKHGFIFMFAQKYHPALKRLAMVRKELGFPTVFNLLGPLLNPANVKRQVIGTFSEQNARIIADVVSQRDYEKAIILTSRDGLDEVSLESPTLIIEITGKDSKTYEIKPEDFGITKASKSEFVGGDAKLNADIITQIFAGSDINAKTQIVALNAAVGFYVADICQSIEQGYKIALDLIGSGKARAKLEELRA